MYNSFFSKRHFIPPYWITNPKVIHKREYISHTRQHNHTPSCPHKQQKQTNTHHFSIHSSRDVISRCHLYTSHHLRHHTPVEYVSPRKNCSYSYFYFFFLSCIYLPVNQSICLLDCLCICLFIDLLSFIIFILSNYVCYSIINSFIIMDLFLFFLLNNLSSYHSYSRYHIYLYFYLFLYIHLPIIYFS